MDGWGAALAGGALVGAAASALLWWNGQVAGVSGILGRAVVPTNAAGDRGWCLAFLAGLLAAGAAVRAFAPSATGVPTLSTVPSAALAGLVVGLGTALGSGCTSGHGVCGLARGSGRSLVATLVFMGAGMLCATLLGWLGGRS